MKCHSHSNLPKYRFTPSSNAVHCPDVQCAGVRAHLASQQDNGLQEGADYPAQFDDAYSAKFTTNPFLANELYLTLLYRPRPKVRSLFGEHERTLEEIRHEQRAALEVMEERSVSVKRMLRDLSPELLGNYQRDGVAFSEVAEFLGYLVNGRWQPCPQRPGPLYRTLPTARLSFGGDKLELRHGDTRYAALVDIKEYADAVEPGILNALLYERTSSSRRRASRSCRGARRCAALESARPADRQRRRGRASRGDGRGAQRTRRRPVLHGRVPLQPGRLRRRRGRRRRRGAPAIGAVGELTGLSWPGRPGRRRRLVRADARQLAVAAARGQALVARLRGAGAAATTSRAASATATRGAKRWRCCARPVGQPFYLNLHAARRRGLGRQEAAGQHADHRLDRRRQDDARDVPPAAGAPRVDPAPRLVLFDLDRGCEIAIRALRRPLLHAGGRQADRLQPAAARADPGAHPVLGAARCAPASQRRRCR